MRATILLFIFALTARAQLPDPASLTNPVPVRWFTASYACVSYTNAHTLFLEFDMFEPKNYGLFVSSDLSRWKLSSVYVPNPGVSNILWRLPLAPCLNGERQKFYRLFSD